MKRLVDEELLRQALGALEQQNVIGFSGTISALRAALEQPAQEPVADGWQLRYVYFQDGEPTMHKEAPQAQQEKS